MAKRNAGNGGTDQRYARDLEEAIDNSLELLRRGKISKAIEELEPYEGVVEEEEGDDD